MVNDHLLALALMPLQLSDQTLSFEVRVALEHRQALMSADGSNLHHIERTKLKQPADGFVPEVMI